MGSKRKLFAAGVAAAALVVTAAGGANAETWGHFTIDVPNPTYKVVEAGSHRLEYKIDDNSPILCDEVTYPSGKVPQTMTELFIAPGSRDCVTTSSPTSKFKVHFEGCGITFTVNKKRSKHGTTRLYCPPTYGPTIKIEHPNCKIQIPSQAAVYGVTYTNIVEATKHVVTADLTPAGEELDAYYEAGICVFLGTMHTVTVTGSLTMKGFNETGIVQANMTATGPED
jgi:hypothetical protein